MNAKESLRQLVQLSYCSTLLMGASLVSAEDDAAAMPFYVMEPYVVVATRTPLGLDRVSPSVSYISAEVSAQWQDTSLVDALAREPGMGIVITGTPGAATSQFTRGTNSNHTAFFLDGRRLNSGLSQQYDLSALTIDNIASVQVERGASSVNYGSNSIGGVVDLRSYSPFQPAESQLSVEAEVGSYGYQRHALSAGVSEADVSFQVSATNLSTDNDRDNDGYDAFSLRPRLDYNLTPNLSVEFVGQYIESEKEVPGAITAPSPNDYAKLTNWLISPGLLYCGENTSYHLFYSRSQSDSTNYGTFGVTTGRVLSDEVNFQADYTATASLDLTVGAVYRSDDAYYSDIDFGPGILAYRNTVEQGGVYAQAIWEVTERLELRGGVRYDTYSDFDNQTTGDFEGIYKFSDLGLTLFAKIANAYSPPRASDIAFDSDPATTPQPEKARSYEAGFRQVAFEGALKFSALYFYNDIKDLTEFNFTGVGITGFDIVNVSEAQTDGIEVKVDYTWEQKLNVFLTYTYLTAIDQSTQARLIRRPRHSVTAGVSYDFTDAFSAGLQASGLFDREETIYPAPTFTATRVDQEDQFVVRLVSEYSLSEHFDIFARIENLFDHDYAPVIGYPALGRTYYAGVRYQF